MLDRLIEKEQEAHKNIGDAATILGLYDAQAEEAYITQAVADGTDPGRDHPGPAGRGGLAQPADGGVAALRDPGQPRRARRGFLLTTWPLRRAAFDELQQSDSSLPTVEYHPNSQMFILLAPDDLRRRCEFIPQEAIPADWLFRLTTDRGRVMEAIAEARKRSRRVAVYAALLGAAPGDGVVDR